VHPVQEVAAYVEALKAGFLSREQIAQQLGSSVFEVDLQNSLDRASAEERGLVYSTYLDPAAPKPETPAHSVVQAVIGKEVEGQVQKWAGDQED
jgi:capsid protein